MTTGIYLGITLDMIPGYTSVSSELFSTEDPLMLDLIPSGPNSSFSKKVPLLQIFLDSTSLVQFKICPRRYYYNIVCGYQPKTENVNLTFGLLLHEAIEHYWQHRLIRQMTHQSALKAVVKEVMVATWDSLLNKPKVWSDDKDKNRFTLVRTIVWYLDKYQNDPIQLLKRKDTGEPSVELRFQLDTTCKPTCSPQELFTLCGRIDRMGTLPGGNKVIVDVKSTKYYLTDNYFAGFSPYDQFTIYSIVGKIAFQTDTEGVIVDACQVKQTTGNFDRRLISRSPYQLNEYWNDNLPYYLNKLEDCAVNDEWPMNETACSMYGGCPYRSVCSAVSATQAREALDSQFKRRTWDPRERVGDY